MRVTIGQTVYRRLLIYSPTTGGLVAPDATPTAELVRNGTTDGAVTVTVTSISTGRYKLSFTIPGTYAVDDVLELDASWAVSSVAGGKLWTMQVDNTVASVKAKTDNLPSDPADASDIASSFSTVNSTLSTISGYLDTEVAAILTAVDTEVAAIKAKTDNLPADPADASDIAASFSTVSSSLSSLASTLSTISGYLDTEVAAILAAVDTEVAAIKAKTDNLPSDPADASDIAASFSTVNSTLSTISTNTQDLPTMITGDGTAGAKFTTAALSNAPSGGGGSVGTSLVGLPLRLVIPTADGCECETPQTLVLNRGHVGPVRLDLVDANGVPVPTTSTTLTAKIVSTSYADILDLDDPTEVYGAEGSLTVQIDTTAAELVGKRKVLVMVTRDNGASDVTSGVIALEIVG